MPQERIFVGIDVSKDRLDVHVHGGAAFALGNSDHGLRALVRTLAAAPGAPAVALEASGGYEMPALHALAAAGFAVWRLDPARVRAFAKSLGRKVKTDPVDAQVIAHCLEATADRLAPWRPDPETERLAALVRFRRRLVEHAAALGGDSDRPVDPLIGRIAREARLALQRASAELDAAIRTMIRTTPRLDHRARILASAPGVGPVLTGTLIAELPELGAGSSRQLAALTGVAPYDHQSGRHRRPSRCAGGRRAVRRALYMGALGAIRAANNPFAAAYHRLIARGKPAKVAIVAVMRKMIVTLNAMLRNDTAWAR